MQPGNGVQAVAFYVSKSRRRASRMTACGSLPAAADDNARGSPCRLLDALKGEAASDHRRR